MVKNRPKQLEIKRKESYEKLYSRQPQLMKRLAPLIKKASIIQELTEPFLHSPKDPLSDIIEAEPIKKIDKKEKLRKELNKFSHSKKELIFNSSQVEKIKNIRPDILWNLR